MYIIFPKKQNNMTYSAPHQQTLTTILHKQVKIRLPENEIYDFLTSKCFEKVISLSLVFIHNFKSIEFCAIKLRHLLWPLTNLSIMTQANAMIVIVCR